MEFYIVKTKQKTFKLLINDIIYICTTEVAHQIKIVSFNHTYYVYGTLNHFENRGETFIKCNRSCVVNLSHISSIEKSTRKVEFLNDSKFEVICSRRLYGKIFSAWIESE